MLDSAIIDTGPPPSVLQAPPAIVREHRPDPADASTDFLGLRFQTADMKHVVDDIGGRAPTARFAYVVTPNVDHMVRLHHLRSDLWPAYRSAWMTLCDSRVLGRLATRAGMGLPIVPGSDLTAALFREVIAPTDRIAVLGGTPASVEALCRAYGLTDVVHHNPPMGFIEDGEATGRAMDFLLAARARYTILAVGSPQQEILAYRMARLGTAIGIGLCVGASLDFLTGKQRRAPGFVQRLSLEWLYRLVSSPGRMWRRYLVDGPLIFLIYRAWAARFRSGGVA